MEIFWTIQHMFPDANKGNLEVIVFPDQTWKISKWDLPDPQPTQNEIIAHWNTNQTAIKTANKPPLSEIDKIKKNHTDLMFSLMNKGVI